MFYSPRLIRHHQFYLVSIYLARYEIVSWKYHLFLPMRRQSSAGMNRIHLLAGIKLSEIATTSKIIKQKLATK